MKENAQEGVGFVNEEKARESMTVGDVKKSISSAKRLHDAEQKLLAMEGQIAQYAQILRDLIMQMSKINDNSNGLSGAVGELNKKVDAMLGLLDAGKQATKTAVQDELTALKIQDLSDKVKALKDQNLIVENVDEVNSKSFLVVEERTQDGKLVSPRTQFLVSALSQDIQESLLKAKAKAGDVISLGEGKNVLSILESYVVVQDQGISDDELTQMEQSEQSESAPQQ